jgi:hypothetical protein
MNQRRAAIAIRVRFDVAGGLSIGATSKGIVNVTHLMNQLKRLSRDFYRRSPQTVEGFARAYLEGVAAAYYQKERALEVGFNGIYSFVLDLPGLALRGSSVSGRQK